MRPEETLEEMVRLTERYAAFGAERGGLVGVAGGLLLVGTAVMGTAWSLSYVPLTTVAWLSFLGNHSPKDFTLPVWLTFGVWATPFLFLAVSAGLRRWLYMGFGRVKALAPSPKSPAPRIIILWTGWAAVVLTLLLGMAFGVFEGHNSMALRLLGECFLAAAFVATMRKRKPQGDELALLLFLWLNAGFASAGTVRFWVPISWLMGMFGLILAIRGLFQHRAFLKLRRELEALDA